MLHTVTGAPGVVVVEGCQGHRRRWETRLLRSSVAQRRRRATTDGGRGEETDHREKNPSVQNVETETGETGKFLKEPEIWKTRKKKFQTFNGKNDNKNETDRLLVRPFWLSFLKNLHKDINRPRLQYWMSWCFPSKFSIRDTESDLIFESMGMGTDGHGWAPMGRSLFFRTGQLAKQCSDPAIHRNLYKIQTNVFKTRNTSLRKGTSWQHSTNHIYHYKNTLKDSI